MNTKQLLRVATALVMLFLAHQRALADDYLPFFSSPAGSENVITFEHVFVSDFRSLSEVADLGPDERQDLIINEIIPVMKFLFGPSTHRALGGPQADEVVTVSWQKAFLREGRVVLPYKYKGVWILDKNVAAAGQFHMPVPLHQNLYTKGWKRCGDSDPQHATPGFFWYFWDPNRAGCDHQIGVHYEEVTFTVGQATPNESVSYPEYERMIRTVNGRQKLSMTLAFGYVNDRSNPNPDIDVDVGANEYRTFLRHVRSWNRDWKEEPILMSEYKFSEQRHTVIGRRFSAVLNGVETQINVVINAGIDQMMLFAESFAHDHDAFFAWMGHSRVGSGFDADKFAGLLEWHPNYYSISKDYQLVYWGGCNSYSYYTLPFFKFKAITNPKDDPHGTRNLDIIAHGLPSFFILNAVNAETVTTAILNWPQRPSYQSIVKALEDSGAYAGTTLLAAVLGDEDNPK